MCTDYDCWKSDEMPVTWEEVLTVFSRNVGNVLQLLQKVITAIK
jgi:5'-methylthioadenosine phosphorylase